MKIAKNLSKKQVLNEAVCNKFTHIRNNPYGVAVVMFLLLNMNEDGCFMLAKHCKQQIAEGTGTTLNVINNIVSYLISIKVIERSGRGLYKVQDYEGFNEFLVLSSDKIKKYGLYLSVYEQE